MAQYAKLTMAPFFLRGIAMSSATFLGPLPGGGSAGVGVTPAVVESLGAAESWSPGAAGDHWKRGNTHNSSRQRAVL